MFGSECDTFVVSGNEAQDVLVSQHDCLINLCLTKPRPLVSGGEDLHRHVLSSPLPPPHLPESTLPNGLLQDDGPSYSPLDQQGQACVTQNNGSHQQDHDSWYLFVIIKLKLTQNQTFCSYLSQSPRCSCRRSDPWDICRVTWASGRPAAPRGPVCGLCCSHSGGPARQTRPAGCPHTPGRRAPGSPQRAAACSSRALLPKASLITHTHTHTHTHTQTSNMRR